MQYQFDALGQEGILCGTEFQTYKPFTHAPAGFNLGGWIANIALGVAVAAACVLTAVFVPAVGIIGSAALIGAAMGTLAVTATVAMEDMADGVVRNWKTAIGQTLLGTVAGAASGVGGLVCCTTWRSHHGHVYKIWGPVRCDNAGGDGKRHGAYGLRRVYVACTQSAEYDNR